MPTKIEAYKCDYCKRVSTTLSGIKNHERVCVKSKYKNKCNNCIHGVLRKYKLSSYVSPLGLEDICADFDIEPYCKYHETKIFREDKNNNAYFIECETGYHYNGSEFLVPYSCFGFEAKGSNGFELEKENV
jgi:hypothetical protein